MLHRAIRNRQLTLNVGSGVLLRGDRLCVGQRRLDESEARPEQDQREQKGKYPGRHRCDSTQSRRSKAEPLYRCSFGWYARSSHPLAGRAELAFGDLAHFPLISSGYADEAIAHRLAQLYGLKLPLDENFAVSTGDVATVRALVTSGDAPSTDVAVVSALRQRSVMRLDVRPALDLELTLGIVEHAGRTRVPAATHAFELVRAYFGAVGTEVGIRGQRKGRASSDGRRRSAPMTRRT